MYKYGKKSQGHIDTLDPRLQAICESLIKVMDVSILQGYRDKQTQDKVFESGVSKVQYPNSKHNTNPSKAMDVAPYPYNADDRESFVYLAGLIQGIAVSQGTQIRWGGDWDSDNDRNDQTFNDLAHFEIKD